MIHSTTAHHTAADYFGIFVWLLVDKLIKGKKENLNETHYYLMLCQLTALLLIFYWIPSSVRRPQLSDTFCEKNVQFLPLLLSVFSDFTFCCTRSCFPAAQVYSIFSGHQSSVGVFFLENENTHPCEVAWNNSIQCNSHGFCLLLTLIILLLPLKPSAHCSIITTVSI